jgi:hypothetical protein
MTTWPLEIVIPLGFVMYSDTFPAAVGNTKAMLQIVG